MLQRTKVSGWASGTLEMGRLRAHMRDAVTFGTPRYQEVAHSRTTLFCAGFPLYGRYALKIGLNSQDCTEVHRPNFGQIGPVATRYPLLRRLNASVRRCCRRFVREQVFGTYIAEVPKDSGPDSV